MDFYFEMEEVHTKSFQIGLFQMIIKPWILPQMPTKDNEED